MENTSELDALNQEQKTIMNKRCSNEIDKHFEHLQATIVSNNCKQQLQANEQNAHQHYIYFDILHAMVFFNISPPSLIYDIGYFAEHYTV